MHQFVDPCIDKLLHPGTVLVIFILISSQGESDLLSQMANIRD